MNNEIVGTPEKRRQHYVPQFFLSGFSNDKKHLACIRRESACTYKLLEKENIKNVCVENCLYEFKIDSEGKEAIFPNAVEDSLAISEHKQKQALDKAMARVKKMSASTPLEDKELDHLLNSLSVLLASFTYRRPSELKRLDNQVPEMVRAFEAHGLDSAEKIETYFRDVIDWAQELPGSVFEPERLAKMVLHTPNLLPCGLGKQTLLKTDLFQFALYLRNCSVLCLLARSEASFVGLDFPTNAELLLGVGAHYWPIAKNMAVVFVDDGKHLIRKHEADSNEVMEWNKFALSHGEWEVAFCSDCAVMEELYKELDTTYECD
jgi:hypothetical protein